MIDLKAVIKLASAPHSVPLMGCVVFDGRNAIALGTSRDPQPWWAAVPCPQPDLKEPVAVPVATIKAHFLRSRHLKVDRDCIHNGQGMRTEWDKKTDWSDALTLLPRQPEGVPVMFELDLDSLDRVLIAAGENDIRGAFNGVLLDCSTGRLVATDGARVHMFERRVPKLSPKKGQGPLHVILPKAAGKWLLYSGDKHATVSVWGLGTDTPLVLLKCQDGMVYTRAIVARYPDVMRVVPPLAQYRQTLRVDPAQLADAVRAMGKVHALDKPKMVSVGIHWGQGRAHAGSGPAFAPFQRLMGDANGEPVPAEALWAYFFPRYLEDAMDCITGAATLGLMAKPQDSAMGLFEGDFRAVVMPQRYDGLPAPSDTPAPEPAPKPAKGAGKAPEGVKPAPVAAPAPEPAPKPAKGPGKAPEGVKPAPVAAPAPEPASKLAKGAAKAPEGAKPAPVAAPAPEPASKPAKGAAKAPEGAKPAPVAAPAPEPAPKPAKGPGKAPEGVRSAPVRRSLKADPAQ